VLVWCFIEGRLRSATKKEGEETAEKRKGNVRDTSIAVVTSLDGREAAVFILKP
jgi:hypothetical protein